MIIFREHETKIEVLIGRRKLAAARARIDSLRQKTGQDGDFMTSLDRFLPWSAMWNHIPVGFLMHRSGDLYGAALLAFRQRYGVPIGLVEAGDLGGQGGVIAAPRDCLPVMETAARILLKRPFAHTVVLSTLCDGIAPGGYRSVPGVQGRWQFRDARLRLSLAGGFEGTMARMGYKMRRNIRYYRRRAEADFQCRFEPEMTGSQRHDAVHALLDKGTYKYDAQRAWALEAALENTPGHFAMGLRASSGEWLSYITGWRGQDGTHVEWQLNHDQHESASLSTVMRAYLLEHETSRQSPAIVFVGGTSPYWSRVCEPAVCGDLLATRTGFLGQMARQVARRMIPQGRVAHLIAQSQTKIGDALPEATRGASKSLFGAFSQKTTRLIGS